MERCDCVAHIAEVEASLLAGPSRETAHTLLNKLCDIFRCSIYNECPDRLRTSDKAHELWKDISEITQ